jgi:hypothetical protein
VAGQWTVPTLICSPDGNSSTSDWVGVNGWNGAPGLFQAGTTSECVNGQELSTAVWSDDAKNDNFVPLLNVSAGDVIVARVSLGASGTWSYSVTDESDGNVGSAATTFAAPGTTAEWIVEDTATPNSSSQYPLANFASVTFTNVSATEMSGSSVVPTNDDGIEMVSAGGRAEAVPGYVTGSTTVSFKVQYKDPTKTATTVLSVSI